MNQNQIHQLTSHLSQALDQNYDVVNMEAVLSVIFALEGTTITKEQLEATRLAKYINQLRRRTKNEQLARRAKSLLKKWREMVGIQQTSNDSNSQVQLISNPTLKPITRRDSYTSESNLAEGGANTSQYSLLQPSLSSPQQDISDLNTNLDLSEVYASGPQSQHKNFSSLINHLAIENSSETNVTKSITKNQTQIADKFKNDHTSTAMVVNEKRISTNASVVIDIVSDSDENESGVSTILQKNEKATQPLPAIYPRPKKLKKERKRREKNARFKEISSQQSRNNYSTTNLNNIPINEVKILKNYPTEILSSNSSMSSIISGDALSGSTQNKHSATTDLTFAGKFKSILSHNADNSLLPNVQKNFCRITQSEPTNLLQPLAKGYDDYIVHNDSSTSCSRLSLFEEVESKQVQNQIPSKSNLALTTSSNNIEYNVETNHGQCPKKRGRKKGSKGVDSKIAKESSLSQQILFGSGVKKVKTTKELFKDIQSRKLGISLKQGASINQIGNATTQTFPNRNSSFTKRSISPCSDTSMHSQSLKMYSSLTGTDQFSNTLDDAENTDSETITSEPSHDSIKFDEIIRKTSLDSNSNSLQTLSAKNIEPLAVNIQKDNDLKTQLLHLVNRMKSPLSVNETEKLYQAEIVPCTCIIIEEMPNLSTGQNNLSQFENEDDSVSMSKVVDQLVRDPIEKKHTDKPNIKISIFNAEEAIPQKAMKSIFDLDFDDDDPNDPLRSIIKNVAAPETSLRWATANDNKSSNPTDTFNETNNVDIPTATSDNNENHEESNIVEEPSSIYIVQEDPNCIARKIFNIQSNDVTNFHINALHNYYVPNINGNWNSIDSSLILNSKIKEFLSTLDSYVVSDGVDVVPKYGSLTYERIPKDLSCLKLAKYSKPKTLKSFMQPFLGIAKCLPSCRLAAKRLREEETQKQMNEDPMTNSSTDIELFKHSLNSLTVDINSAENDNKEKIQYSSYKGTISKDSTEDNTSLGCNLLQLVNNSKDDGVNCKQSIQLDKEDVALKERRCSSTSSLGSINEKIENQRYQTETTERNFVERNRKKRRKTSKYTSNKADLMGSNTRISIKRIKIAINGDIATERQLPHMSSSNQSSDDDLVDSSDAHSVVSDTEADQGYIETCQTTSDYCEKESIKSRSTTNDGIAGNEDAYLESDYNNGNNEYAIVQRPVLGGGNNHIVLTIKKTPSKIHSPVNLIYTSLSSAALETETAQNIHPISNNNNSNNNINVQHCENLANESLSLKTNLLLTCQENTLDLEKPSIMLHTCPKNFQRCRRLRRSYSEKLITQTRKNANFRTRIMTKLHKKLFFKNELYREDNKGQRERIFNYSSSSDCENESIMGEEPNETEQLSIGKVTKSTIANIYGIHKEDFDISSASEEESIELQGEENTDYTKNELCLPNENNNMLQTFNSIFDDHTHPITNSDDKDTDAGSLQTLQVKNCDEVNSSVYNNYNNLNVLGSPPDFANDNNVINDKNVKINTNNCNSYQTPFEYRTGVRTVLDSRHNTRDVDSFSRVQQFKEWHEVLQIQSYNDEPLTVLPYVVLE